MGLRLLWLTENYPPQRGGMAQSCDRIVNGLRESGYEIEIVHFTTREVSIKRNLQKNGGYTPVSFLESEPHTLNLTWNYIQTLGHFDYIVSFGGYLSMISAPIYTKWMGSKLITFLRGNDFDTSIFTPRKRDTLQYALEESSLVFSVSKEKVDKVKKWIPGANVHFVANGIDIESWQPTTSEEDHANSWREECVGDKLCLGLIGQLKPKKGLHFFLNALSRTSLTSEFHLLLVGDIEENDQAYLEEKELSYSLMPFLDRFELMKYYLSCDAVVIPSFYDGMPNVMLEAGALGIPIIASRVDGMADLIEDEVDGLLFAPGNEDECRKALYKFVEDAQKRKKMGSALKEKIASCFTLRKEIENYENLII